MANVDIAIGYVFSMITTAGTLIQSNFTLGVDLLIWSFLVLLAVELSGPKILRKEWTPTRTHRIVAWITAIMLVVELLFLESSLELLLAFPSKP